MTLEDLVKKVLDEAGIGYKASYVLRELNVSTNRLLSLLEYRRAVRQIDEKQHPPGGIAVWYAKLAMRYYEKIARREKIKKIGGGKSKSLARMARRLSTLAYMINTEMGQANREKALIMAAGFLEEAIEFDEGSKDDYIRLIRWDLKSARSNPDAVSWADMRLFSVLDFFEAKFPNDPWGPALKAQYDIIHARKTHGHRNREAVLKKAYENLLIKWETSKDLWAYHWALADLVTERASLHATCVRGEYIDKIRGHLTVAEEKMDHSFDSFIKISRQYLELAILSPYEKKGDLVEKAYDIRRKAIKFTGKLSTEDFSFVSELLYVMSTATDCNKRPRLLEEALAIRNKYAEQFNIRHFCYPSPAQTLSRESANYRALSLDFSHLFIGELSHQYSSGAAHVHDRYVFHEFYHDIKFLDMHNMIHDLVCLDMLYCKFVRAVKRQEAEKPFFFMLHNEAYFEERVRPEQVNTHDVLLLKLMRHRGDLKSYFDYHLRLYCGNPELLPVFKHQIYHVTRRLGSDATNRLFDLSRKYAAANPVLPPDFKDNLSQVTEASKN